jgi:hypothetical protein
VADRSLEMRWRRLRAACLAPVDPALRYWRYETGDEGRCSAEVAWVPQLPEPADLREAELARVWYADPLAVAAVYADALEQRGELDHANRIRSGAGIATSLPEAALLLTCATQRLHPTWCTPMSEAVLDELVAEYRNAHPLLIPAEWVRDDFTSHLRWVLELMRNPPIAALRENGVTIDDAATFEPPLGTIRNAFALADEWNDKRLFAETATGYAFLGWATGA